MMWDLLHCVGVDGVLTLWHALLLERSVLLVSDTPALLGASCEALRALLHPLRWECTYVPLLPRSLLAFLETPTPFLMATQRRFLAERAAELDTAAILVADLDYGRLRYGAAFGKLPPLPRDPLPYLAPLPRSSTPAPPQRGLGPAARDVRCRSCAIRRRRTPLSLSARGTLQPAALRSAINARPGAAALERTHTGTATRARSRRRASHFTPNSVGRSDVAPRRGHVRRVDALRSLERRRARRAAAPPPVAATPFSAWLY